MVFLINTFKKSHSQLFTEPIKYDCEQKFLKFLIDSPNFVDTQNTDI